MREKYQHKFSLNVYFIYHKCLLLQNHTCMLCKTQLFFLFPTLSHGACPLGCDPICRSINTVGIQVKKPGLARTITRTPWWGLRYLALEILEG